MPIPRLLILSCLALAACVEELPEDPTPPPALPLVDFIETEGLRSHLQAFQDIADANDGHRSAFSSGYSDSLDYAAKLLENAGYIVRRAPFDLSLYEVAQAELEQLSPTPLAYTYRGFGDQGFTVLRGSGSGEVTAELRAVDLILPPGPNANTSTSGCEEEDWNGFPAGGIALVQRGSCTFATKAELADQAGAAAVLVFNEGQPGRRGTLSGVLSYDEPASFPVLGLGFAAGDELATALLAGSVQMRVAVQAGSVTRTDHNLVAETPGGDPNRVLMVGGHLDSAPEGPGINDNGSGSALVLEAALGLAAANIEPRNKVRFALWGAEELGLVGSASWMSQLEEEDPAEISRILAYLNFDMVASPNGVRFLYEGDDTPDTPPGTDELQERFEQHLTGLGLEWELTDLLGAPTDSTPFVLADVPCGGLYSGSSEIKTEYLAGIYGGQVGESLDPCYHQPCDDIDNVDLVLMTELAQVSAHVIEDLAMLEGPLVGSD
jgi:Zn-dependent M28 family amino/carboxypeptidase